jgi:hypothetical protein
MAASLTSGGLELLFCDETHVPRPSGAKFFLYGGLAVPASQFASVCDAVASARNSIGLLPSEPLKFSVRARPERIERSDWTAAKELLLSMLAPLELNVFSLYLHEAVAKQDHKAHWALTGVCVSFERHLSVIGAQGFVVVDHSKELHRSDLADLAVGTTSVSVFQNSLPSIRGVSFGHVENVLPLQAVDVVLGSIRYCLEKPEHDVSSKLAASLSHFSGVLERRPWNVKVPTYASDYKEFLDDWCALGERFEQQKEA